MGPMEVRAVAQALRAVPSALRPRRMRRILLAMEMARSHIRRTGRLHPLWGQGRLSDVLDRLPRAAPGAPTDADWCDCQVTALLALAGAGRLTA